MNRYSRLFLTGFFCGLAGLTLFFAAACKLGPSKAREERATKVPSAASQQAGDPGIDLNCVIDHIQNPPEAGRQSASGTEARCINPRAVTATAVMLPTAAASMAMLPKAGGGLRPSASARSQGASSPAAGAKRTPAYAGSAQSRSVCRACSASGDIGDCTPRTAPRRNGEASRRPAAQSATSSAQSRFTRPGPRRSRSRGRCARRRGA